MNPDRYSVPEQELAINQVRGRHFNKLIQNGVIKKIINTFDETTYTRFGGEDTICVVTGSRHGDELALFLGFQRIDSSTGAAANTKLIPVGRVIDNQIASGNRFTTDDALVIAEMYHELEKVRDEAAPDYNVELGVFIK